MPGDQWHKLQRYIQRDLERFFVKTSLGQENNSGIIYWVNTAAEEYPFPSEKSSVLVTRSDGVWSTHRRASPSIFRAAERPEQRLGLVSDEIDGALAKHYGFTDEELDFIINYDIKYRMGQDMESDDEQ